MSVPRWGRRVTFALFPLQIFEARNTVWAKVYCRFTQLDIAASTPPAQPSPPLLGRWEKCPVGFCFFFLPLSPFCSLPFLPSRVQSSPLLSVFCMFICIDGFLSLFCLFVCLFVSFYLFVYLCVCMCVCLSVCLCVCLSVYV